MRLILALLMLTTGAHAQDATPLDSTVRAEPGAVALYLQAVDLYALGQRARDPLMVVTAARAIEGLTLTDVARLPDPAPAAQPAVTPLDAATLLATARTLDAGANYADLIEQVAREPTPKPKALSATGSTLPPGKAETWTLSFYGGTYAELAILGDGRSNLDLTVSDAAGRVICADHGSADRAICGFALRDNGAVKVTVTNAGDGPGTYMLLTQ
ncbi:MAG: hypothetical protein H7245_13925 [Candidatus Saccharibacteria bacterium]|nr:hypothetical protein [Pseudorhodobacter sp.]